MKLVYLSSEVYQSHDYTFCILEVKKKWQPDLPAWKVIFILNGAARHWKHKHLPSWWPPAHSQNSKPILLRYRWQLKIHGVPISAEANSTLQESFVALSPFASFYFIMFASERQKSRVKKAKRNVPLDAVEYLCGNAPHAEFLIPAHGKTSQPPGRPC